jgi:hypothetical protein
MAYNFNVFLIDAANNVLNDMPSIDIDTRTTDKKVVYDKKITRLDRIAGDIYEDESLWKIILWANSEYECEFDIPDGTIIRVPFPKNDVLDEVIKKIINRKNLG